MFSFEICPPVLQTVLQIKKAERKNKSIDLFSTSGRCLYFRPLLFLSASILTCFKKCTILKPIFYQNNFTEINVFSD